MQQQQFGTVTEPGEVSCGGHDYAASPAPGPATPYCHPGGKTVGEPVPAGWDNTPWSQTALVAARAWIRGQMLVDLLLGGGLARCGGGRVSSAAA